MSHVISDVVYSTRRLFLEGRRSRLYKRESWFDSQRLNSSMGWNFFISTLLTITAIERPDFAVRNAATEARFTLDAGSTAHCSPGSRPPSPARDERRHAEVGRRFVQVIPDFESGRRCVRGWVWVCATLGGTHSHENP
jgi:hypothetical protein